MTEEYKSSNSFHLNNFISLSFNLQLSTKKGIFTAPYELLYLFVNLKVFQGRKTKTKGDKSSNDFLFNFFEK